MGIFHDTLMIGAALVLLIVASMEIVANRATIRRSLPGWARIMLPVVLAALAFRLLAPFGPHVAKGRDFELFDSIRLATSTSPYDSLLILAYRLPARFLGVFGTLRIGQALVGAGGAALVAVLTWMLTGRTFAAASAGFMAAVTPALFRVDASVSPEVELRFLLLAALVIAEAWRRRASPAPLAAIGACLVLAAYTRPEAAIFAGLVPMAMAGWGVGGARAWLSSGLATAMLVLLYVWWPLSAAAGILYAAWSWRASGKLDRRLAILGAVAVALVLPRILEIMAMDRSVMSRLEPFNFVAVLTRRNILLRWEAVSPVVPALAILGLIASRRTAPDLYRLFQLVGLPVAAFYTVFMGDLSAIMKFQGIGLTLLLPLAGMGADLVRSRLAGRGRAAPGWVAALAIALATTAPALPGLVERNLMQSEFRFLASTRGGIGRGKRLVWPTEDHAFPATPPVGVLLDAGGATVIRVGRADPLPPAMPDLLVYMPASCSVFRESEPLPGGVDDTGNELLRKDLGSMGLLRKIGVLWDTPAAIRRSMSDAGVTERALCARVREAYDLCPVEVTTAARSMFEGYLVPVETVEFGYYEPCP